VDKKRWYALSIIKDMKLSEHLDLSEVTRSDYAKRNGIDNMPNAEHTENLIELANKIFEPIRNHFKKPIRISSGYRSNLLNIGINGAKNSQHTKGQALDIDQQNKKENKDIFDFIKDNLDFDQLINEFDYDWIHVSYNTDGKQRKQILDAIKEKGKTKYIAHR
jgi:zinc D-Ala-D-Ala carboxypeptidase